MADSDNEDGPFKDCFNEEPVNMLTDMGRSMHLSALLLPWPHGIVKCPSNEHFGSSRSTFRLLFMNTMYSDSAHILFLA